MAPKPKSWIDPNLFKFGMQLGSQPNFDFGEDPNMWDQQFQNPYSGGQDPYAPQQTAQMGPMSGMMDPRMGMNPGMGQMGPGMGQGMPQGMGMQGPTPQQQGPAGYDGPVMSDIDLRNNPYYQDGYQGKHPAWHRFMQYTGTPQFADSMMAGAIAAGMSRDPEGTMQRAIAFKQHRDQRRYQAQQNELQRESMLERTKLNKDITNRNKMYYQIDSARKDIANSGFAGELPPMPEDEAAFPMYLEGLRQTLAEVKKGKQEQDRGDKLRQQSFGQTQKTGVVPDEYANDPMFHGAAEAYKVAQDRKNFWQDLATKREDRIKRWNTKTATGKGTQNRAKGYDRALRQYEGDINRYEQNIKAIEQNGIYPFLNKPEQAQQRAGFDRQIEYWRGRIDASMEQRDKLQAKWDALVESQEGAEPSYYQPPADDGTEYEDAPPEAAGAFQGGGSTSAPPATSAAAPAPAKGAMPSDAAVAGFWNALEDPKIGPEKARRVWRKKYPGVPAPDEGASEEPAR